MSSLWASSLLPELSQGDLLEPLPFVTVEFPEKKLKRGKTLAHGVESWQESPSFTALKDGRGAFLAMGRALHAVVVSESCEIDKEKRILIAPVVPVSSVSGPKTDEWLETVRQDKRYPFVYVPDASGILPESYIDLRGICPINRNHVDSVKRLASMSDTATNKLRMHIVAYFVHIPLSDLKVISTKQP